MDDPCRLYLITPPVLPPGFADQLAADGAGHAAPLLVRRLGAADGLGDLVRGVGGQPAEDGAVHGGAGLDDGAGVLGAVRQERVLHAQAGEDLAGES